MMVYAVLNTAVASIVATQIDFSHTVNLGALLLAAIILIGFAWAQRQDKRSERWEKLYTLADYERKELQHKLDEAMEVVAEQNEVIQKLEALQMPTRVMEVMNEGIKNLNQHATERQTQILKMIEALVTRLEQLGDS